MGILNNAVMVITLCEDAADRCPITSSYVKQAHWMT